MQTLRVMKLSFAEKIFFSRSTDCYLQTKKWRYNYDPLHLSDAAIFPCVQQIMSKIIEKNDKALSIQGKKKCNPQQLCYLLASSCNLISVEGLKSPQITTANTAVSLCPLNTSMYRKCIQRILYWNIQSTTKFILLFPSCQLSLRCHFTMFFSSITSLDSWLGVLDSSSPVIQHYFQSTEMSPLNSFGLQLFSQSIHIYKYLSLSTKVPLSY